MITHHQQHRERASVACRAARRGCPEKLTEIAIGGMFFCCKEETRGGSVSRPGAGGKPSIDPQESASLRPDPGERRESCRLPQFCAGRLAPSRIPDTTLGEMPRGRESRAGGDKAQNARPTVSRTFPARPTPQLHSPRTPSKWCGSEKADVSICFTSPTLNLATTFVLALMSGSTQPKLRERQDYVSRECFAQADKTTEYCVSLNHVVPSKNADVIMGV